MILSACPFCLIGKAHIVNVPTPKRDSVSTRLLGHDPANWGKMSLAVRCAACLAQGPLVTVREPDEMEHCRAEAARLWNEAKVEDRARQKGRPYEPPLA